MYFDYFGLIENPFTIAPNPRYLYMSSRHQEALAHLLYGVQEGGGFVQLTGEVGTGKTTLTRALLEQLPENVDAALVLNPKLTAQEFLATICDELNVAYPRELPSVKSMVDALNAYLLSAHANGRRVVLIVDEAQNFQPDVLEQIRLLTNLETTQQKLLQIILVGQPELRDLLARKELRQLAQRVTARYHLAPMTFDETKGYIKHRLKVAGSNHEFFSSSAIRQVWRYSTGVPRLVNILADRALLGAYSTERRRVTASTVHQAHRELHAVDISQQKHACASWLAALAVIIMLGGGFAGYQLSIWDSAESMPEVSLVEQPSIKEEIETVEDRPELVNGAEFKQQLLGDVASQDLNKAFESIFSLWGDDINSLTGNTVCDKALTVRKRCFWGNGDWSELVRLNRPALAWMINADEHNSKHYFVVEAIEGEHVSVMFGERRVVVSTAELQANWPGNYLVLWQPPSLDFDIIRPGEKGNLVLWLRHNIENVLGLPSSNTPADIYDAKLVANVKRFQSQQGLTDDGLVGEITMLYLGSAINERGAPLLLKSN